MKKTIRVIALMLIMVMMGVSSVSASEMTVSDNEQVARTIHFYTENNRHFTGSYDRFVAGSGYTSTYLDAVMNISYYYEEGVYAEIAEYSYSSSTAKHCGNTTTCNYYPGATKLHNGSICAVFGINGVMYRCHLTLDEWADSVISRFGLTYEVD